MIRRFTYPTAEEANAFCDGVEFVNDSQIVKVWVEHYGHDYIACVEEEGEEED